MAARHPVQPDVPRDRLAPFSASVGHAFGKPELLREALTHGSATGRGRPGYERLEFLGDRVLGLVVAEALLERFPGEREGDIAKRHAKLVRRETLAEVARGIGLGEHLIVSRGEEEAGARHNPGVLADSLEAVIAAIYLDAGLAAARRFVLEHWAGSMSADERPPRDPKTTLQEWAQGRGMARPVYTELACIGPAHAPVFTVEARLEGMPAVEATGRSKREAEQGAALGLLSQLGVAGE
jgi:ribonuclease-3